MKRFLKPWLCVIAVSCIAYVLPVGAQIPRVCSEGLMPSQYRERWTLQSLMWITSAIRKNERDVLTSRLGCRGPDGEYLDLRGVTLENVEVGRGNYALEGADLSYSILRNVRFIRSYSPRMVFRSATLDGVSFDSAEISNVIFQEMRVQKGKLSFSQVIALSAQWSHVAAPGIRIAGSTFLSSRFNDVDFSEATITNSQFQDLVASDVSFRSSEFYNVIFTINWGSDISWSNSRLSKVDISNSNLIRPDFSMGRGDSVTAFGVHLHEPILGPSGLNLFDWRFVLWDSFVLGDEASLERAWRSRRHSGLARLDHRTVSVLYGRLVGEYRSAGMKEYERHFGFQQLRFERHYQQFGIKYLRDSVEEWLDGYGTSGRRLLRTLMLSIIAFGGLFLCAQVVSIVRHRQYAWQLLKTGERPKGRVHIPTRIINPTGLLSMFGSALIISIGSLSMFAGRVLNLEGLFETLGLGKPYYCGISRPIAAVAGIWGLVLAVRGVGLLT
jgi:uncharacterized protein YjbI with pentapeptide repeats